MTRDKTTVAGLVVVGLAAAALTFTTLFALAVACGFSPWLAWLLPVALDVAGLVALRIWMRAGDRFAQGLTITCIGLSVAGNAAHHGLAAYGLPVPWWGIVVVSAVPPAMLAAVVRLAHGPVAGPDPAPVEELETPAAPIAETIRTPIEPTPRKRTSVTLTKPTVEDRTPDTESDEQLAARLTTWTAEEGTIPSRERVRVEFGIGTKRAARLREMVGEAVQV